MPPFCIIHDQFWARGPEGVWACVECSREFWHAVSAFLLGALLAEQVLGGAAE